MKIDNEFTVQASIDRAWALLTDVEAIAPCMPGAQLTGIGDNETYEGKVKVKMGPVVAEYKGTAVFIEKDDEKYRGVIDAKGRDSRGAGNASAMITVQLRSDGASTTVSIDTELKISGKIAQFGAGMIQEVSEKLLGQFVGCLEGKLAEPAPEPAPEPELEPKPKPAAELAPVPAVEPAATIAPVTAPPARRDFHNTAEPEALDLLDLAGGAAFKRLLPMAIAGAAVVAAVIFFLTRR
jgi:carbon monoxide dehydrogenase subunit G